MEAFIDTGVLLGLSGGADSVMLLCFFVEYRKRNEHFPLLAIHVNHGIRGLDADSDESFSRQLCHELGVEFLSIKSDIPKQALIDKMGIEECARKVRYFEFDNIISGREDINCIAVAHNADDNVETVLLNMLRGSGSKGMSGIPPVRDNIIRPLIKLRKSEIVDALDSFGIPYVTDQSNFSNEYKRNFIRNEISPKLSEISQNPALMIGRMSDNLRSDDEFISCCADDFLNSRDKIFNKDLLNLHRSLRARVIPKMINNKDVSLSSANLEDIYQLLKKDNFRYSLPSGYVFVCERGLCSVFFEENEEKNDYCISINNGENYIPEFRSVFCLSDDRFNNSSLNIYKLSIQADISSAIIEGDLYLRPKRDGDRVFYGGMTHKIKKLYSDRKIPVSKRPLIPLLCDDKGVVWAPGFGVRNDRGTDKSSKSIYASISVDLSDDINVKRFYFGTEFK